MMVPDGRDTTPLLTRSFFERVQYFLRKLSLLCGHSHEFMLDLNRFRKKIAAAQH
jgi:hypothetical protein